MRTQEFFEQRRSGIGGSDAPKVLGVSPWGGPYQVYEQKRGLVDDDGNMTPAMELGLKMESIVADDYRELTNMPTNEGETFHRHPDHKWMIFHADRFSLDGQGKFNRLVELKTVGPYAEDDWGAEGSDEIPEYYIIQCQHGLAIVSELFNIDKCDVCVRFRGSGRKALYAVEYDADLVQIIIDREMEFWHKYVITGDPPPVDGSVQATDFLRRKYPKSGAEILTATPDIDAEIDRLKALIIEQEKLTGAVNLSKNLIMDFIGAATAVQGTNGKITWSLSKDSDKINWQAVAEELKAPAELIAKHTKVQPGSRRFVTPRAWKKEIDA